MLKWTTASAITSLTPKTHRETWNKNLTWDLGSSLVESRKIQVPDITMDCAVILEARDDIFPQESLWVLRNQWVHDPASTLYTNLGALKQYVLHILFFSFSKFSHAQHKNLSISGRCSQRLLKWVLPSCSCDREGSVSGCSKKDWCFHTEYNGIELKSLDRLRRFCLG